jgi:nucleotide-binding universal stress UspA family protein
MAAVSTIAVGYDGSPYSLMAVRWAAELALAISAQVVVVHAIGLLEGAAISPHPDAAAARRIVSPVGWESGRVR